MTTLNELIIAAKVDASGVETGLDQAAKSLKQFGGATSSASDGTSRSIDRMTVSAEQMRAALAASGGDLQKATKLLLNQEAAAERAARQQLLLEASAYRMGAAQEAAAERAVRAMGLQETAAYRMAAQMEEAGKRGGEALGRGVENGAKTAADNVTSILAAAAAAVAGLKLGQEIKGDLNDAGRYQTLGVTMEVVGRNAGKTAGEMGRLEQSVERTGISMIQARNNLTRMAAAQLDLSKATQLARVAQDAAVIANINSSEAFERVIQGVTAGQVRILRTMGIFVAFGEAEKEWAHQHGRTAASLSDTEKLQIRLNAVLEEGQHRAGAYEASMGTVGKELKSTERYLENVRVKAGTAFLPEYTVGVKEYADALKYLGDNSSLAVGGLVAVTAALGAVTLAWKGDAIVASIAGLGAAASPVLVTAAAVVTLATVLGSAAADAANARRDVVEFAETLKQLPASALGRNINSTSAQIAELRKQLADSRKPYADDGMGGKGGHNDNLPDVQEVTEKINRLVALRHQYTEALIASQSRPTVPKKETSDEETEAGFQKHVAAIRAVTEAYTLLNQEHLATAPVLTSLLRTYGALNAEIREQASLTSRHAMELLKARVEMEKTVALQAIMSAGRGGVQQTLGGARAIAGQPADAVATAQAIVERMGLMRDLGLEFTAAYADQARALTIVERFIDARTAKEGYTLELMKASLAVEKERAAMAKGLPMESFTVPPIVKVLDEVSQQWNAVIESIHGVVDAASGLGLVGPQVTAAANGALHAVEALKKMHDAERLNVGLSTAEKIGAAVGIIGGVVSAIGGLAALFTKHDAILDANNQRLDALRAAMVDTGGLGGQSATKAGLDAWFKNFDPLTFSHTGMSGGKRLDEYLSAVGVSIEQLDALAKQFGIDWRGTSDGLRQLDIALGLSAEAARKFGFSVADITAQEDLRAKLYGKTSPVDALNTTMTILRKSSSAMADEFFKDADTTSKEGRDKIRKGLQDAYERLANGMMTADELGRFGSAKDFEAWLARASDGLDALDQAANAVTGALLYVPTGFKVALARFNATDPQQPTPFGHPIAPTTRGGAGTIGTNQSVSTGSAVTQVQASRQSVTYSIGAIHIDAKDKPASELWPAILKEAQRQSQVRFGRSDRWADVN